MKIRFLALSVLVLLLIFLTNPTAFAVYTRDIDRVRDKGVLDSEDFEVIDEFVRRAIRELVKTKDFTSIARVRSVILANDHSNQDSAAVQYSERFSTALKNRISSALEQAQDFQEKDRKAKVVVNLLILIDQLADLRLLDLAIKECGNENTAIRYWAVHAVTNRRVTEKLNSTDVSKLKLAKDIIQALKKIVDSSDSEIISLIVDFTADINIKQGEQLLVQIADLRIKQYEKNKEDDLLLDAEILKSLYSKMSLLSADKPSLARRFGQLYSYAIQLYISDIKSDQLNSIKKQQLASVLVEIENKCISKLLGIKQTTIKRAIEREDSSALLFAHNKLLGDDSGAGNLVLKLQYDYGKNENGIKLLRPLELPERKLN